MQDAKHSHFVLVVEDLVDRNEWEGRKGDLSRVWHPARTPEAGETFQSADALDYRLGYSSCGIRTAQGNVVADPFEIICGVRRPADAH
jgi:hypothetical protein